MSTEDLGPRQKAAATKRARTRRWIIEAARPLFEERGWYGVTREQIAKAAEVGVATVHNNFTGKRNIVIAVYEPELLPIIERAEESITNGAEPRAVLMNFICRLTAACADHPALTHALLPVNREECVVEEIHPMLHQLVELLAKLLEADGTDRCAHDGTLANVARYRVIGMLTWIQTFHASPRAELEDLVLRHLLPTLN